jgi:hypothetical protein
MIYTPLAVVPEPSALVLLGAGGFGFVAWSARRRSIRRKKQDSDIVA